MQSATPATAVKTAAAHPAKLTDAYLAKVKPANKPQKISIEKGLYLLVSAAGSKTWYQAYVFANRQRTLRLGDFPYLTLEGAKVAAYEVRQVVAGGVDPSAARAHAKLAAQAEQSATLAVVAREWLAKRKTKVAPYTYEQSEAWIVGYICEHPIGLQPISKVTAAMIYKHISGIADGSVRHGRERGEGSALVASRVKQQLGQIFRFAISSGRAENNPVLAIGMSDIATLPPTRHNRALEVERMRGLIEQLRTADIRATTRAGLLTMLLTACRTNEVIESRWVEFDLDAGLWNIPATRMKNGFAHIVPLSRQAVDILRGLHALTGSGDFVFPAQGAVPRPMSRSTFNDLLRRLGMTGDDWFRSHGARGSFSTWAYETGDFRSEVIEKSLSHTEKNRVKLAYSVAAQYLGERRELVQRWADAVMPDSSSAAVEEPPAPAVAAAA